jgi:signal transduction histidine kinase
MLQVLESAQSGGSRDARTLLSTQVVPKRELVIRVSEEAQSLNRSAFVQQQREVAEIYGASQRRLWQILGGALTSSFAIGWLVTTYAGRLEGRLQEQRLQDARSARELQDLSAKLITAQEEERRSVARELHDEVGQVLTAIKVELAVAQRTMEARGHDAQVLEDARSITEGALTTVRDLSHFLHPAVLDDLGLPATVDWYLRGFSRRHGISADLKSAGTIQRLAPELEASSYRIIQEALTNIAKHSGATACEVSIQQSDGLLTIAVQDNGAGFPVTPQDSASSGLGLIGIRERASHLGGTVRIETAPGRGTRITVELPARARALAIA